MRAKVTAEMIRNVLDYDPHTGILTSRFKTRKSKVGSPVGSVADHGRLHVGLHLDGKYRTFKAHRLAWIHYYGEWPSMDLDHKDGNPANNRISNLRLATVSQNLGNMKKPATNKSGKKGVSWHALGKKWQAHIKVEGVNHYLGLFGTVDEAHAAYRDAAVRGRGEFARME